MDTHIKSHLPLIMQRITFAPKSFPLPPQLHRMDFSMITVLHHNFTPPLSADPKTGSRDRATPRQEKTPLSGQKRQEHSVMFDNRMNTSPLSPLMQKSESETEDDSIQSRKIKKQHGGPGCPGGKGYNLQSELDWSD